MRGKPSLPALPVTAAAVVGVSIVAAWTLILSDAIELRGGLALIATGLGIAVVALAFNDGLRHTADDRTEGITRVALQNESVARRSDEILALLRDPQQIDGLPHVLDALQRTNERLERLEARLTDAGPGAGGPQAAELLQKLRRHEDIVFDQLQALLGIYADVAPERAIPPLRGWAASPDVLAYLLREVGADRHTIVEIGSGSSTAILGRALARRGTGGHVHALEHHASFAEKTRALVRAMGAVEYASVHHGELTEHEIGSETFRWYDRSAWEDLRDIDLLFVDGPPGDTGELARYPAVPLLRGRLAPGCLIVLDDAGRADERAVADRWAQELGVDIEFVNHEKGTAVLRLP